MAGSVQFRVQGIADLKRELLAIAPKLRRRALRNALAAGARVFRDEARRRAPVLKLTTLAGASAVRRGIRKPGTLRNAIRVRTSKLSTRRGDVGVFVNVKPLKGGGANNPNDPYYWRWQEFGWNPANRSTTKASRRYVNKVFSAFRKAGNTQKPGAAFLRGAATRQGEALRRIEQTLGPQLRRLNVSKGVDL
jgi:HK97 gp10 family phage protein